MNIDPDDPDFPLQREHVNTIRTIMMGRNEARLRKFLFKLTEQNVPPGLLAIVCSFTMASLPDEFQEFWKPIAPNWEGLLPEVIKDALHNVINNRKEPERSLTDIHIEKMLRASMTPEKAALLRSKASVN